MLVAISADMGTYFQNGLGDVLSLLWADDHALAR